MDIKFYSYGSVIRILALEDTFADSVMIDVNLDDKTVLSVFDADNKFDADFIQSYLNILRESTVGFRALRDSDEDNSLRARAVNVLGLNQSHSPKTHELLNGLGFSAK